MLGVNYRMAIYVYETIDTKKPVRRFEISQSMKETPLTKHPESGEPIRRVITGGYGLMVKGAASEPPPECGRGPARVVWTRIFRLPVFQARAGRSQKT